MFCILSVSELTSCILRETYSRIHLIGVRFIVERRSLLCSKHGYFANTYRQKGPSVGGKKLSLGGRKEGMGGFCLPPPTIQLNKAFAREKNAKYILFEEVLN